MKSTSIQSMEEITNIPPLRTRRKCKAMIQATKYQCSQDHPMNTRLKQLSSGRLKRSSFALETRALQRKYQEVLPKYVKPIAFTLNDTLPPHSREDKLRTSVPNITTKAEQTSIVKKTLTMSKLEEKYPSESWVRLYRWISHKCYNERRGWYIHSVSQMESSNQRQYQQAYTVPTTKLKGKPSFMLHIPSSAKLTTTFKLYS
jgi:hypothetical protein